MLRLGHRAPSEEALDLETWRCGWSTCEKLGEVGYSFLDMAEPCNDGWEGSFGSLPGNGAGWGGAGKIAFQSQAEDTVHSLGNRLRE